MLTKHEESLIKEGCQLCKVQMPELDTAVWWLTPWGELILSKVIDSIDTKEGVVEIELSWIVKCAEDKFYFPSVFGNHVWKEFQPERLNPRDLPPTIGGRYAIV